MAVSFFRRGALWALLLTAPLLGQAKKLAVESADPVALDRQKLRELGVAASFEALRAYLIPESKESSAMALRQSLAQLDSNSQVRRRQALQQLLQLGPALRDLLEREKPAHSAEMRQNLKILLEALSESRSAAPYALREISRTRHPQASATILEYLSAEPRGNEAIETAVQALLAMGWSEELGPARLSKLQGDAKVAWLRAWRLSGRDLAPEIEALFADQDPRIRLEAAALALARGSSRGVVPMASILVEDNASLRLVAEDWLMRSCGAAVHCQPYGEKAAREAARDAWKAWLDQGGQVSAPAAGPIPLPDGQAVICDFSSARVLIIDKERNVTWELKGVTGACHVQWLPSGNLLITAAHERRVFEYDRRKNDKGVEIGEVWSFRPDLTNPSDFIGCAERMPNGNTMVLVCGWTSGQSSVLEVDPLGQVVGKLQGLTKVDDVDIMPDGRLLVCETGTDVVRIMDWSGLVHWQVRCSDPREADWLPNGNVLIADGEARRVIEVDPEGKIVWEYRAGLAEPHEADRLPNGNTVICDAEGDKIIELTPEGNLIWAFDQGLNHPDDIDFHYLWD